MKTVNIQLTVPEDMTPYLADEDMEHSFERNAMILFPYIRNLTISEALPKERLDVTIEGSGSEARAVTIEPRGARYGEGFHEDSCV